MIRLLNSVGVRPFNRLHPPPPTPPAGCQLGPPDFVGIGTQKSGTSWWYQLISSHPKVYHPEFFHGAVQPWWLSKERHFFTRYFAHEPTSSTLEEYWQWFPRPPQMVAGEWTPAYLSIPWAPALLKQVAPKAKILVLLRDPVDRFRSGLNMDVYWHGELHHADVFAQVLQGLYAQHLEGWVRHLGRERILVLQYEKCRLNPQSELRRTFEFLGLENHWKSDEFARSAGFRIPRNLIPALPKTKVAELTEYYASDVKRLVDAFPEIDLSLWPNFR